MKKLTNGQRFALAREARRLAMECVEGTAPELGRGTKFTGAGQPACVAGHVQHRAHLPHAAMGSVAFHETILLITENDRATKTNRHAAVVFPLLALADELEASAASLPQAAT